MSRTGFLDVNVPFRGEDTTNQALRTSDSVLGYVTV